MIADAYMTMAYGNVVVYLQGAWSQIRRLCRAEGLTGRYHSCAAAVDLTKPGFKS